jgi:hypothetical protein
MTTQFKTLFVVTVAHAYYNGNCEDVTFIVPADTAQLLRNGKLLAKELEGKLYVLFETDEAGAALIRIPGKRLRFGLHLINPFFSNFTALDADFASSQLLYQNAAVSTALDEPIRVTPVGQVFSHVLGDNARPVTVELKTAAGLVVAVNEVTATNDRSSVSYDLTGQLPGTYTIEETYPASTREYTYYVDAELAKASVFGVIEVEITSDLYAAAFDFQVAFEAREETLKYYVVASNYSAADFNQLSVLDTGFTEEGRAQINFSKVSSASFTAAEISPALLGDSSSQVVLFKSQAAVARMEKGRRGVQLKKNSQVLIEDLPQPSAAKPTADLIIPVYKTN